MTQRRLLLGAALATLARPAAADPAAALRDGLAALERRHGGRLGVAMLDTGSGVAVSHRGDERFALCSTFKALAAAYVLARVDRGQERLDRRIAYAKLDPADNSPITAAHFGTGMTVGELCAAAIAVSDNTAANLILASFGGPAALTAYLRGLGDMVTRLDRWELALNYVGPGDPRDTTTPRAMLASLRRVVLGDALSPKSRRQLQAWLIADEVGTRRLRAGVPAGWTVGDKTGTGPATETNDVAVLWPPGRPPLVVTAYYVGGNGPADAREAVLAAVGKLAASA